MSDIQARINDEQRDRRAHVQAMAQGWVNGLIDRVDKGEVSTADNFSHDKLRHESFMMEGNGPTAIVHYLWNGADDMDLCFAEYSDAEGSGVCVIPDYRAEELHAMLTGNDKPEGLVTWANGFGIWHVRVPRDAKCRPLLAARRALREEITSREAPRPADAHSLPAPGTLARSIWAHPIEVEDMSTETTIVYREGDPE